MSDLISLVVINDEARVDSRLIATQLGVEHESFRKLVYQYQADFEEFGILRFEIGEIKGRGQPEKYALLNEDQSYLGLTYAQNTPQARALKIKLVRSFSEHRRALTQPQPQPTPAPVRKPIRSRDDLSFTQRDNQGQLQNWVVAYDRNSSWHINVAIGKAYFEEVLELGQHDPAEAQDAVQYALVNGAATNFRPESWGIECGFAMALAEALFASPRAPKRGITHQKIQPKQLVYQEDVCQKVLAAIQGEKQHGMTARGLQQACWTYRRLSADKRVELLNTLIEDEKIVAMVPKGKRTLTYVARPFVSTQELGA